MFWGSFFPGLDGFEEVNDVDPAIFREYMPDIAAFLEEGHKPGESVLCTGKIKHVGSTYVEDFKYLASLVKPEEVGSVKLTLAAPNWYHLRYKEGKAYPAEVYATPEAYFEDIAKAYQEELKILYEAGCRNVQFDDPNLACTFLPGVPLWLTTSHEVILTRSRLLLRSHAQGLGRGFRQQVLRR